MVHFQDGRGGNSAVASGRGERVLLILRAFFALDSVLARVCTVYLEVCRLVYSTIALELLYAQLQVLLL